MSSSADRLRAMLSARSVAVVGAGDRAGSFGWRLTTEALRSPGIEGEEEGAAGGAVEAVDGKRQPLESETKLVKKIFQALVGARSRMDGEPRRLVDHDRLAVYVKNPVIPEAHGRRPAMAVAVKQRQPLSIGFCGINTKLTFCLHIGKD